MTAARNAAIEQCLAAQQRFERLRAETMMQNGGRLCDLSYANAYDGPPVEVITAMREALQTERPLDFQYTPYGGSTITRRMIAHDLSARGHERLGWRNVVLTPGAMAALNIVFRSLQDDPVRTEVIVITPCWLDYPLYLANLGLTPRFVPVDDETGRLDLDAIAAALGPSTRAIILSQPANPTGVVYRRDELTQLAELLARAPTPPVWISDECHREILFDPESFTSPLELYDDTCVVYSFGKKLFIQGQRCGYIAVSPCMKDADGFARTAETMCRVMGFCTPTALMQIAIRTLLGFTPDLTRIAARRARALSALQGAGYPVIPSEATFFLYAGGIDDDFEFAKTLAGEGVLVLPSSLFHQANHFRISLTATDDVLDRALLILAGMRARSRAVGATGGPVT